MPPEAANQIVQFNKLNFDRIILTAGIRMEVDYNLNPLPDCHKSDLLDRLHI